jgi:hypothetical protein
VNLGFRLNYFLKSLLGTYKTCKEKNCLFPLNSWLLYNNKWGDFRLDTCDKYHQEIYRPSNINRKFPVGWRFDCKTSNPYVKGYPNIYIGKNPYSLKKSNTCYFPRKIKEIEKIEINYNIYSDLYGIYNIVFDIFLKNTNDDLGTTPEKEIMIFLGGTLEPGNLQKIDTFHYNNNYFDLYHKVKSSGGDLFIFSLKKVSETTWFTRNKVNHKIFISEFIHYLTKLKLLNKDLYMYSLSFGTEMWSGEGIFQINNLQDCIRIKKEN